MSNGIQRTINELREEIKRSKRILELREEIKRLKRISERQSAMLAQALKEKNDLRDQNTILQSQRGDSDFWLRQHNLVEKELNETKQQLRDIKIGAKVFFRAIGIGS